MIVNTLSFGGTPRAITEAASKFDQEMVELAVANVTQQAYLLLDDHVTSELEIKTMPFKVYTAAPADYDYGGTTELDPNVGTVKGRGLDDGRPVRLVECKDTFTLDMQTGRYASGLFFTRDEAGFVEELKHGFVTLP
jgi:hypothetical protein